MLTFGNTEVASEVAKDGIHLPCYEGSVCLRIAPGQGLRNHDAGIIITLADIRVGDVIEFEYVVIPQANNDFFGSLSRARFFDWRALLPIASWTHFAYTVPDLSGGGPSLMSLVSATEWTLMVWVENTVGDQIKLFFWLDDIGVQRRIPEPGTILLIAVGLVESAVSATTENRSRSPVTALSPALLPKKTLGKKRFFYTKNRYLNTERHFDWAMIRPKHICQIFHLIRV